MRLQILTTLSMLFLAIGSYAGALPATQPVMEQAIHTAAQNDFPFKIAFEQGASKFDKADQITITEVRGTGSDMQSGICRISGTYTLASQEKATLAASITARDPADARGPWNRAQTIAITKGHGTFTLLLPVNVTGWPHVSFYSATNSFGGTYIGTGDSVLRHWWGS